MSPMALSLPSSEAFPTLLSGPLLPRSFPHLPIPFPALTKGRISLQESLERLNHAVLLGEPSLPAIITELRLRACEARQGDDI